jgi:hypothetical protein
LARKPKNGRGDYSANEKGRGFAAIPRVMLESQAFCSIKTLAAAKALPVLIAKWGAEERKTGRSVCEFHYSEAERLHGIPRKSFSRGLQELHKVGFFDFEDKGGTWNGNAWTPARYRRSERWRKFGTSDFVSIPWKPSEPATKRTPQRPARDPDPFTCLEEPPKKVPPMA